MSVTKVVALLLVLPTGSLGASCSAGYKKATVFCSSSATTASSCNSACCGLDDTKCLKYSGSIVCAAGKYKDSSTLATTTTAAGGANKNTDCCTAEAACSAGSCSPGYKKKATLTNLYCTSSATTAAACNANCCELDDTKCLKHAGTIACAAGKFNDAAALAGTAAGASGANKNTACCTAAAACSAGSCSPGYKKKATLTNLYCTSSATTAAACNANCCELDDTKCLNYVASISCAAGKYNNAAALADTAAGASGANKNTACCTAKAACSAGSCSPGYKKKATLTNLYCTSSATTAAACNTNCCELDDTKCLNYAGSISCASGKYNDAAALAGTAAGAAGANKNTACCTAKASCSSGSCSAGYTKSLAYCSSSLTTAASCNSGCCTIDDTKCLKYSGSISCAAGKYKDSSTLATTTTAAGGANKDTDCCTAKAACSAGSCSPGYKKKATLTNLYCTSSATTAAACNADCCELDDTKCAYYVNTAVCPAGKYKDTAVAGTAVSAGGANKITVCCTAKAVCSTNVDQGGSVSEGLQLTPKVFVLLAAMATVWLK